MKERINGKTQEQAAVKANIRRQKSYFQCRVIFTARTRQQEWDF
jgi:hypothetical protein